jgi:hypothetical protein
LKKNKGKGEEEEGHEEQRMRQGDEEIVSQHRCSLMRATAVFLNKDLVN